MSVVTILPNTLTHSFVSASPWRNPRLTGSNLHPAHLLQAPGNQPVQAGRTQATAETSEEGEEEGDGAEPVGRRRQTAGQHHPGLRHPGPKAAEQVRTSRGKRLLEDGKHWHWLTCHSVSLCLLCFVFSSVNQGCPPRVPCRAVTGSSTRYKTHEKGQFTEENGYFFLSWCQILKAFLCFSKLWTCC